MISNPNHGTDLDSKRRRDHEIKELDLSGVATGPGPVPGAVAHGGVGGIAGLVVEGHISNCAVDIVIDSNRLSLGMYAGGVVGAAEDARVAHCVFDGSIHILGGTSYYIDAGDVVGNVQGHSTVSDCLNRGVMDANEYDFEFLTLGDIVGRWEGESVFLQSGRRDTLSGHRRTASSMTKEGR